MFAARLMCSWIGAFGLAGAFCQGSFVTFSIEGANNVFPCSINEKGAITGRCGNTGAPGWIGFLRLP